MTEESHSSSDDELDSSEAPSLEESLRDITRLLSMALDNRFHEAYRGTEKWYVAIEKIFQTILNHFCIG